MLGINFYIFLQDFTKRVLESIYLQNLIHSSGKDALFPSIGVPQISHSAPDLSIISDIEKLKTSDVFKSRKDMNEHVEKMKESWVGNIACSFIFG